MTGPGEKSTFPSAFHPVSSFYSRGNWSVTFRPSWWHSSLKTSCKRAFAYIERRRTAHSIIILAKTMVDSTNVHSV